MERREKNPISTFLLVVGVIFILIAGSIFISTAWEYLPESGKKIVLLLVTAGLLAGSTYLYKMETLHKLEMAFYYLGTGFAGYTVMAFLGGITHGPLSLIWMADTISPMEYVKIVLASFVILSILSIRFFIRKEAIALGIAFVFLDNCIFWGCLACGLAFKDFVMMEAFLLVVYAVVDYFMGSKEEISAEYKGAYYVFIAFYIAHILIVFWGVVFRFIITRYVVGEMSVYMLSFVLVSTFAYLHRRWVGFRVINSLLILGFVHSLTGDVFYFFDLTIWEQVLVGFFLSIGIVIWLRRRELFTAQILLGQVLILSQPYMEVPVEFVTEWESLIVVAGIVLLGRIWYDKWETFRWIQFVVICQVLFSLLWNNVHHGDLVNALILALICLFILVLAALYECKEYTIASSVTLCLMAFHLTRNFWLSLEWWMYLFIAGVVLIILAVRKER